MRITRFQAENFKRLVAVEINPDDHTVVLGGRNAQGKSSVLDGIMAALSGKKGSKELTRPIRDGESKAAVVVELDDLRVERKWTPSGSTVTVGPKDGSSKFNSPQAILDKLIGSLSFDPLEFAEAAPKQQVETLIDIVGRERFDEIGRDRKEAYDQRTDVNREVKRLEGALSNLPNPTENLGDRVDVSKLSIELEAAIEVERARATWQELEDKINEMRERQKVLSDRALEVIEAVKPGPSDQIRELLANAQKINSAADIRERRDALVEELNSSRKHSEDLTSAVEHFDAAKTELVEQAELPIEGLSFDEEGVQYNGVPFAQASAAERLRVSVAMAMAMNPELRVICIRDASLLDSESRQALVDLATEHDYQIWYEVVGDVGEIGVVIEDGQVRS